MHRNRWLFAHLPRPSRRWYPLLCLLLIGTLLGTTLGFTPTQAQQAPPPFVREVTSAQYDGTTNDLLTGGLGADGFTAGVVPPFADPANPTAAEIRTRTIYNNYLALVPETPGGGYGTLFGPSVGVGGDGKIAGKEYLAYADDGTGQKNVTLMVQIPDSFDPANPCIVTGPSSGSRGVYGAIGTSGEWGLKKGCAVAYTDKGSGMGVFDIASRTVNLRDGTRTTASAAGNASNFTPILQGETYEIELPNRLAFKHAHSRQNPEADWGLNVLQSIEFAFYVLNLDENFGQTPGGITPANTTVIAASVSNGGAASVRAAEQDTQGLIDGIAVSEPNTNPQRNVPITIMQDGRMWTGENVARPLLDYYTYLNLYQACANIAPGNALAPFNLMPRNLGENRCQSLRAAGLLQSDTLDEQATEAQQKINDYGILSEQNLLMPFHYFANTVESISVLYTNSYGRFGVEDNVCGFSYGAVDASGMPITATQTVLASQFSDSNGIPPSAGIALINDNAQGGPSENRNSVSSNGVQDQNLEGALCLRRLYTGQNMDGSPLTDTLELQQHQRIVQGISEIQANGNLKDIPMVIVNGRNDAVLAPNHTSRAYYALNRATNVTNTVRYYEILNAHHLDAFNDFPGYNSGFVPLHHYFFQALDLMHAYLSSGTPLPPSQVVPTTPRGLTSQGVVPPITRANVPPIANDPVDATLITTSGDAQGITLTVPDLATLPLTVASDDPTPLGSVTTLTATLNVTATYVGYSWDLGDGTIISNTTTGTISHTYQAPGLYTVGVTATTSSGLAFAATVVEVDETPAGLTAANSSPTPLGSATAFTATLSSGSNATYTWDFGDGSAPASGANASYTYPRTGTFTATVTARNAIDTLTASTVVTITDAPISGLAATNSSPTLLGQNTAFTATITGGSNVAYTWDFGDGSTPTSGITATYIYPSTGSYTATVTATNSLGSAVATTVVDVVTETDSGLVTPETGGAISTGTGDEAITVIFPAGIVSETIRISLTSELTPSAAFTQTVLRVLRVTALTPEGVVLPDVPLNGEYTIRFRYSDAQLAALGLTEDALQAFVLVNGQYVLIPPAVSLATTTVDPANNLVSVQTDTISEFVVGGAQAVRRVYLPIVVRADTSQ